jgi:hypothetical protein
LAGKTTDIIEEALYGKGSIDVNDWQASATYFPENLRSDATVLEFWNWIRSLNVFDQRQVLRISTGYLFLFLIPGLCENL